MKASFVLSIAVAFAVSLTNGAPNILQPSPHLVGGKEAEANAFPYMAAIEIRRYNRDVFCGGALLTYEWVLTAAHCVYLPASIVVALGAHDISNEEDTNVQYLRVRQTILHPKYNNQTQENDIALLHVPGIMMISDLIEPVRLPTTSQNNELFTGWNITVTGWGATNETDNQYSRKLQVVNTKIWRLGDCKVALMRTKFDQRNICASDAQGNRGLCRGDTGGPAVVQNEKGRRILVGIATLMDPKYMCEKPFPMVFTRVTSFLDWILETTGLHL